MAGVGKNTYGETVNRVRHTTDARVVGISTTYEMTTDMIHLFRENRFLTDKYVPRLRKERAEHHKLVRMPRGVWVSVCHIACDSREVALAPWPAASSTTPSADT